MSRTIFFINKRVEAASSKTARKYKESNNEAISHSGPRRKEVHFLTSDPQELVDQVFSKITEMYNSISKNEEEVGYEKLLVGISVNLAHDLAKVRITA